MSVKVKRFNRSELKLLSDIKKAKQLVDRHCSGLHSDALCDALFGASEFLGSVLKSLKPSKEA